MPPRKKQAPGPVRRSGRQAARNQAQPPPSPPPPADRHAAQQDERQIPPQAPPLPPVEHLQDPALRIQARLNALQGERRRLMEDGLQEFEANFLRMLDEVDGNPANPEQNMAIQAQPAQDNIIRGTYYIPTYCSTIMPTYMLVVLPSYLIQSSCSFGSLSYDIHPTL